MSLQLDLAKPGAALRRSEGAAVFGSAALPFAEAAITFECDHGLSLAQIVDELIAQGLLDAAWREHLTIYLDDIECPPAMWARVKPRPGRIVAIRARPGLELAVAFLIDLAINIAVAVAVNALVSAFVGGAPEQPSFEQIKDIEQSRNEIARFRKLNAVFGKFRVFPIHAAKAYTEGADEKVILYMLLTWGLAPVALESGSLKIGDTPIEDFEGVTVQHKLTQAAAMPTLFPSRVDEDAGYGVMNFAAGWQQRTTTADDAEELQVEIVFTQGLIFYSGDGGIKSFGVSLRIRYREEGSGTWLDFETGAAAAEGHDYVLSGYKKRKPFRMTFKRTVPAGRYEVAVKRDQADDPGPKGYNEFAWTKLRTFTKAPPVLDNNLALTAIKIEAGDQINGVVDLVNGVVTRIAPLWDDVEEEFGAEGETQNPAEIVRWIACGPGAPAPRDPETEIDNAAFGAWAELCTLRGWKCDYELRAGGGQDEVMESVARCGRGSLVERSGKLSVVIDDVQPAPSQKFTPRNAWGFRSQRRYPRATHALRLQFNNEEKNYVPDEMFVYYPGYDENTAELIITVPMLGKTSPLEVYQGGLRIIAEDVLRPEDYAWRCDIENLTVKRGQRVALSHYVIAVGRKSARVKALTLNGGETHVTALTLDEEVVQTPGDTYGLAWRKHAAGVLSVESIALTNMGVGAGKVVTLAAIGGLPLASAPAVGDLVTFGDFGIETLDAVVQSVQRISDFEGEISAVPYMAELWDGDSEELPPWSSNVSGDAFPRPPAPVILGSRSDSTGMFVAYDFPFATADRVQQVEAYWRQDIDSEAAFELVSVIPASTRVAAYPPGEGGVNYKLKLVSVGSAGQRTIRTPSAEISIISAGVGPGLTGVLTNQSHTVATNAAGTGGDFSDAGGAFKLWRGDLDISDGTDPDFDTEYELVSADAGLTIAIDADTGVYTITNLTVDHATATLRASSYGQSIDLVYSIAKSRAGVDGGDGSDGVDAQTIRLTATAQQFSFDPENNANPAAQSITLTVNRQNVPSGTVSWSSSPSVTLTGTGDSRALSVANFGANTAVEITATLGSLTDKITIVRLRNGGNLFTTVRSANVSLTGRALKKESGSGAWDSQAYSVESYVGGAFCSAKPNATNAAIAFGLNTDPTTNADRSSIDYAWDLNASGQLRIYENGTLAWDNGGSPESYTTSTVLSVTYDGSAIRYFKDGVLKRSAAASDTALRFYFDSSFFTVGGQLNEVAFGPSGASAPREVTRYKRSTRPPDPPTDTAAAGWSVEQPAGSEALWRVTSLQTQNGLLLVGWGDPVLITTPNWRGAFNAVETYYREDAVTFGGGSYKAKVDAIAHCMTAFISDETPGWRALSPSGLSIAGGTYTKVRAHVRFTNPSPPTWEGKCYYVTGGHAVSESFHKQIAQPAYYQSGHWMLLEWDMAALTAGGSDWTSNTITQIRLDFTSAAFNTWEIDYVEVVSSAGAVGQRWDFTSGAESWTASQVTSFTHSGSKAPSGTAESNAWWEVISAPGEPGEPGDPPSGFSATIDLTSTTGTVNLRTLADANGYTGLSDATITFEVESGVTIQGLAGAPNGGVAIDSGTWPTSSYTIALTLTIKSGGIVRGGGGKGGKASEGGGSGGDAIYCRVPMTVNINSGAEVKGAGGGGGGGLTWGEYDDGGIDP